MILVLISLVVGLFLYYFFAIPKKHPKSPPGPVSWPIIGNIVQLAFASPNPLLAISSFSQIYGPIYSLRIGSKDIVVISSKAMMESISLVDDAQGRDLSGMFYDRTFGGKNLGIITGFGEAWKKTRFWTFNKLKDLDFGKTHAMEYFVREETDKLFERIESVPDNIMRSESLFGNHLMSISYQMINSRPLTQEDKQRITILQEKIYAVASSGNFGAGLVNAFPPIRHLLPGLTGKTIYQEGFGAMNIIGKQLIQEAIIRVQEDAASDSSFADLFAEMMIVEKNVPGTIFTEENFLMVFQDILIASTDTGNGVIQNAILQLALNKDIQEKAYQEVKKMGENIVVDDMKKMPYFQAVIYEALRTANVVPNLLPRKATKDFMFAGYFIKEGRMVMADMVYIYANEDIWKNALEFHPERFLDANGEFIMSKDLIPFGTGPRRCPGEMHGLMTVFLFLTQIIQTYVVSIPTGDPKPRTDMAPGFTLKPYEFRCMFKNRTIKKDS